MKAKRSGKKKKRSTTILKRHNVNGHGDNMASKTEDGNMGLADGFCEPYPRKYGNKVYLRLRSFYTREAVELARDAVKRAGGLAKIVPYKSYRSNMLRLYVNANNSQSAYEVINCIYCMGRMWYDGPAIHNDRE